MCIDTNGKVGNGSIGLGKDGGNESQPSHEPSEAKQMPKGIGQEYTYSKRRSWGSSNDLLFSGGTLASSSLMEGSIG